MITAENAINYQNTAQRLPTAANRNPDSIINRLDQIQKIMREVETILDRVHERLDGPTPQTGEKAIDSADNMASRLMDLNAMAQRIYGSAVSLVSKLD